MSAVDLIRTTPSPAEHIVDGPVELYRVLTEWLASHGRRPQRCAAPALSRAARAHEAVLVEVTVGSRASDVCGASGETVRLRLVLPLECPPMTGVEAPALRRARLTVGDITLDVASRTVRCAEASVELTGVEFELLTVLLARAGEPVDRDDLSRHALGRPCDWSDRSVDMHVSKLRRKLGPQRGGGARILTVRGVGYVYTATGRYPTEVW